MDKIWARALAGGHSPPYRTTSGERQPRRAGSACRRPLRQGSPTRLPSGSDRVLINVVQFSDVAADNLLHVLLGDALERLGDHVAGPGPGGGGVRVVRRL